MKTNPLRRLIASTLALGLAIAPAGAAEFGHYSSGAASGTLFGTGADGNLTCSGAVSITRDMNYANLTVQPGCAINLVFGFRIFVSGVLDLSAAPAGAFVYNGAAGSNASGAAGGTTQTVTPTRVIPPPSAGASGATATTTTPSGNGGAIGPPNWVQGGCNMAAGAGGASATPNAGSSGGAAATSTVPGIQWDVPFFGPWVIINTSAQPFPILPGCGGPGGGAGGGDGTNAGGGGGTGANSGGFVVISANTIQRGTNTTAGIIQSKGGNGGNGANGAGGTAGGGGGGSGGGGGFVYIVAGQLAGSPIPNAIDVSGGNGGNAGNGVSTGNGGTGGAGGRSGNVQIINLAAPSFSQSTDNQAGSAGNANSGATGGTGGAGASLQVNL